MRKCIAVLTAIILLPALFCTALAANSWYCPQCGRQNDSNFCPVDGTARPTDLNPAPAGRQDADDEGGYILTRYTEDLWGLIHLPSEIEFPFYCLEKGFEGEYAVEFSQEVFGKLFGFSENGILYLNTPADHLCGVMFDYNVLGDVPMAGKHKTCQFAVIRNNGDQETVCFTSPVDTVYADAIQSYSGKYINHVQLLFPETDQAVAFRIQGVEDCMFTVDHFITLVFTDQWTMQAYMVSILPLLS